MGQFTDKRKRRDYQVAELVTGGIEMFLFKEASRNAFNNDRSERFRNNYYKIFRLRLPHMDTVDAYLRLLAPCELENLKAALVAGLIEQKVLHRFRLLGKYFMVAIDGTGTNSYAANDAEGSRSHKTSKNGITTYSYYVVEAKLVTSSGFAISLASEWVANEPGRSFKKQDCEHRAFERLALKLKKHFPKLPICLLADGLYPNQTFMKTCAQNQWGFVVALKDDSLKNLQQDLRDTENRHRHSTSTFDRQQNGKKHVAQKYDWVGEPLCHEGHNVYWLSCTETVTRKGKDGKETAPPVTTRFVFLSSMEVGKNNVRSIAAAGRMRWKIENEGFNTQKNGGYGLGHKYSRSTFACYKNYYQCLQIAHIVNQLVEQSKNIADMLNAKTNAKLTIKHIWKDMVSFLRMGTVDEKALETAKRFQIRTAT